MTSTSDAALVAGWQQFNPDRGAMDNAANTAAMGNIERTINLPPHKRGPIKRQRAVKETSTGYATGVSSVMASESTTNLERNESQSPSQHALENAYFETQHFGIKRLEAISSNSSQLLGGQVNLSPKVPPHLRGLSATPEKKASDTNALRKDPSQKITPQTKGKPAANVPDRFAVVAAAQKKTQENIQARKPATSSSIPMNSGTARKSAKHDARYPCSYADCADGFADKGTLDKHKYYEHDGYCQVCDIDCEDEVALTAHKIDSYHGTASEPHCIGCGMMFFTGAAYVKHIMCNECKDPRGLATEAEMRKNRREAALNYATAMHEYQSKKGTWSYNASEDGDESVAGGVRLGSVNGSMDESLLDRDFDNEDDGSSSYSGTIRSDRTVGPEDLLDLEEDGDSVAASQDFDLLTMDGDEDKEFQQSWAKRLDKDSKPPLTAEGRTLPRRRADPRPGGYDPRTFTTGSHMIDDWHGYRLEEFKDNFIGQYHCPFPGCTKATYKRRIGLLNHLVSGYHWGTDYACVACSKRFDIDKNQPIIDGVVMSLRDFYHDGISPAFKKNPPLVRLITHMEKSDSCGIKKSEKYGHIVHILTGGFLGILRDEENRPYFVQVDEPTADVMGQRDEWEHPAYGDQW
ncbi:uncharacterized protein KY384_004745 [Bacidia gigantensis]|uniref:uncharacterized protein n=1 Tax=Bacidia gigantensis TaxID=2732470 RepID=UPI001D046D38|nr:uncharacterized protein KY384_004745 [Bacidia gigantensis]KAG8530245.1 hypothetical protein KY384_004745 [Bacidia gigantensis]